MNSISFLSSNESLLFMMKWIMGIRYVFDMLLMFIKVHEY